MGERIDEENCREENTMDNNGCRNEPGTKKEQVVKRLS